MSNSEPGREPRLSQTIRSIRHHRLSWTLTLAASRVLPKIRAWWPDQRVPAKVLSRQVETVLSAWGMPKTDAALTASYLLYADLHGIDSHGCSLLQYYDECLRAGTVTMTPSVRVVKYDSTTALIDGGGGLGYVPADKAMKLAIAKCLTAGIGAVSVRNSGHFGAAGAYAAMAAKDGLIGMATTSTGEPAVVPTFGLDAMLGTNALAFAAPARENQPFLLDMATSTASMGKIAVEGQRGRSIPQGWALDREGQPVTKVRSAMKHRRLTPLGSAPETASYKGYGLATMVEVLSNVMSGTGTGAGESRTVGHFFLAIDPRRFRDDGAFEPGLDALMDRLRATRPADPKRPVMVPGDPEYAAFSGRTQTGIPLPRGVVEDIRAICRASRVPFLLDGS